MSVILERECGTKRGSLPFIRQVSSQPHLYQRFALDSVLENHAGPVNDASFNQTGDLLVSGSDDCHVNIWNLHDRRLQASWQTAHTSNIFSVVFLPETNDEVVISAAGDGQVQLQDLHRELTQVLIHHDDRVKVVHVHPESPHVILSCSEDKTVKEMDTRVSTARNILKLRNPLHTFDICYAKPWLLAVGGANDILRVFDRRKIIAQTDNPKSVWSISMRDLDKKDDSEGITGVRFSKDGNQILANFLGNYVYLLSVHDEHNGVGFSSQKRKRMHFPPTTSSCQDDDICEEAYLGFLLTAVKHLRQGDIRKCKEIAHSVVTSYENCWEMYYILVKCHIFEKDLEEALKVAQHGIQQTHNSKLLDLEKEIIRLRSTSISREPGSGIDCVEMAEMVNTLGLYYDVLFPDGMEDSQEEIRRLEHHHSDSIMGYWGDGLPDNAETLIQLMGSPVSGLVDQDDESSLYDWGWSRHNTSSTELEDCQEISDSHEAMLAAIGKTVAAGDASRRTAVAWDVRYRGHVHTSTIKSVSFLTPDESLVSAGSDDGRLFIWDRDTGEILTTLKGDRYAVNGAVSHPYDPLIASWGVDDTVKIWTPSLPHKPHRGRSFYTRLGRNEIVQENEAFFIHAFD